MARFSPDGLQIVFSHRQEGTVSGGDLSLVSLDGKEVTPLVKHPANDTLLGWSHDGSHILFISDRGDTKGFWAIRIAGGKPKGEPFFLKAESGHIVPLGFTSAGAFWYGRRTFSQDVHWFGIDPVSGKRSRP